MTSIFTSEQIEQLINLAKDHNKMVDEYKTVTLKAHFGSDTITIDQWFEANHLIKQQKFYDKGMFVLKLLRLAGIDCKMDMQSEKLHCPEIGVSAY